MLLQAAPFVVIYRMAIDKENRLDRSKLRMLLEHTGKDLTQPMVREDFLRKTSSLDLKTTWVGQARRRGGIEI